MKISQLLDHFPKEYTPRQHQIDIVKQIEEAVNGGVKFIILQAPTGSGKSMFSATISNYSKGPTDNFEQLINENKVFQKDNYGGYKYEKEVSQELPFGTTTLTITKTLQNQYCTLFNNASLLKGKQNYSCNIDNNFNADIAPCSFSYNQYKICESGNICEYLNQRNKTIKSKFNIYNYNMFLSLPDFIKRREFLICDEASEIEDELIGFFSININYKHLDSLDIDYKKVITDDNNVCYGWLSDLKSKLNDNIEKLTKILEKSKVKTSSHELVKLRQCKNLFEQISKVLDNWHSSEYITEYGGEQVQFTPLYASSLSKHLFDFAEVIILMSATIIDHKTFAKTLGINNYRYIEADSVFDSKKAPIYCPGKYKLNYSNIDTNLPKVIEQIVSICDHYKGKSGIIHTHNFRINEAIRKKVKKDKRFLFRMAGFTNEQVLEEHFERGKGSIIVSPSMSYGVDLAGEHGEFQIVVKLPYLPLGSKRIKILIEKNSDWYKMKMLVNLIQMSGRIIRSVNDTGETYILDGDAVRILKENWNILPKWFVSRLV